MISYFILLKFLKSSYMHNYQGGSSFKNIWLEILGGPQVDQRFFLQVAKIA